KDQERLVGLCDLAKEIEIARLGQIKPGIPRNRLQDDSGYLARIARIGKFHRCRIVKWQQDRVLSKGCGHARAVRLSKRERAGPGLDQQRINMPMITALKLDDL